MKTAHSEDTTCYALLGLDTHKIPIDISSGGAAAVIVEGPEAEAAIEELVAAGCPIVRSNQELLALSKASRGRPVWELASSSEIGLWRDQWGTIWLRARGQDPVAGAVHLSKYEALGLAEQLLELSRLAPEPG